MAARLDPATRASCRATSSAADLQASAIVAPLTVVAATATAADALRVALARADAHGVRVLTVGTLASRLSGGFLTVVSHDALLEATNGVISAVDGGDLGELAPLARAPGLAKAVAKALASAWRSGVCLDPNGAAREATLARLEARILGLLPPATRRPQDLAAAAIEGLRRCPHVGDAVEFRGVGDLEPCWRPLVAALAECTEVRWACGPRRIPDWVREARIVIDTAPPLAPALDVEGCATPRHEVLEAMRWARALLASGVPAGEVAIAAVDTRAYDDLLSAAASEAGIDVHFARGRRAVEAAAGQAAAALASVLEGGPDLGGMRRLWLLSRGVASPLGSLSPGWARYVPDGMALGSADAWRAALAKGAAPAEVSAPLVSTAEAVASGAAQAGEILLRGIARETWRRALLRGTSLGLAAEIADVRVPDALPATVSVAWMDAAALASCPRSHVRLLGLTARSWPRRPREDPILPDRVLRGRSLDWRHVPDADREDFATIVATTSARVSCSFPRRDARGREARPSDLLAGRAVAWLRADRVPATAMSEADRLAARPAEFAATQRGASAASCWHDWRSADLTAHDGLVRPGHPAIARALCRVQSPASLRLLLRDPLGFVWRHGLGWRSPAVANDGLDLDASDFGTLTHRILDVATRDLEAGPGLRAASQAAIEGAVRRAREAVGSDWRESRSVPPDAVWSSRLAEAAVLASVSLVLDLSALAGERSKSEMSFGATERDDGTTVHGVALAGTPFAIGGRIDRLDVSADGLAARVVDYKTGAATGSAVVLGGGKEIQRCLYARAVAALLPRGATVEAALLFPRAADAERYLRLEDPAASWSTLSAALAAAHTSLSLGRALPGPDAGGGRDGMAIALPASRGSPLARKKESIRLLLGDAATIWSEP